MRRRLVRLEVVRDDDFEAPQRPTTWGDCAGLDGPCPYVGCSMNLYLDVEEDTGHLKFNFPHLEPHEMKHSCALVEADRGGLTLEEVAVRVNLTRERVRQLDVQLRERLAQELAEAGIGPEVLKDAAGAGQALDIISRFRNARARGEQ